MVQEINRARENAESDLLDSYRQGKLALFLDIDGTDERLERISGTVGRTAFKGELAYIEGKIGTIVGRLSDLDTFAHKFLADRGHSDLEAASINHETTSAVDQALSTGADPVAEAAAPQSPSPNTRSEPVGQIHDANLHSRGRGRPGKGKDEIEGEFKRRDAAGEVSTVLADEARALWGWYNDKHPEAPEAERPKLKTIKNNLRTLNPGRWGPSDNSGSRPI